MAETTQRQIVDYIVSGLRTKLGLQPTECYPILAPTYVEGQAKRVIQVIPGGIQPSGTAPEGGQVGGYLMRRQDIMLTIWWTLKLDRHQRSDQILIRESEGFLDFSNTVRECFDHTTLGGLTTERVGYKGETATNWADPDKGVVRRDLNFTAPWACRLPTSVTI